MGDTKLLLFLSVDDEMLARHRCTLGRWCVYTHTHNKYNFLRSATEREKNHFPYFPPHKHCVLEQQMSVLYHGWLAAYRTCSVALLRQQQVPPCPSPRRWAPGCCPPPIIAQPPFLPSSPRRIFVLSSGHNPPPFRPPPNTNTHTNHFSPLLFADGSSSSISQDYRGGGGGGGGGGASSAAAAAADLLGVRGGGGGSAADERRASFESAW